MSLMYQYWNQMKYMLFFILHVVIYYSGVHMFLTPLRMASHLKSAEVLMDFALNID